MNVSEPLFQSYPDALRQFVAGGTAQLPGQQEAAGRLGLTVENLRVSVSGLRRRYRHVLRAQVASTASDPGEIENELHYLYQASTL